MGEALKRRSELLRLIAAAEADWLAAESEIERLTGAAAPVAGEIR
jgi:hypothetical protein